MTFTRRSFMKSIASALVSAAILPHEAVKDVVASPITHKALKANNTVALKLYYRKLLGEGQLAAWTDAELAPICLDSAKGLTLSITPLPDWGLEKDDLVQLQLVRDTKNELDTLKDDWCMQSLSLSDEHEEVRFAPDSLLSPDDNFAPLTSQGGLLVR